MTSSSTSRRVRVGVVGVPGSWSTEALADALAEKTEYRLVVDPAKMTADFADGRVRHEDVDLGSLDGLVVKKLGPSYGPGLLDRIELLRVLAGRGVAVISPPERIARVINRLSCTVLLREAGVPMPPTSVTEDLEAAERIVADYGRAVLKPLYSTKASGMCLVEAGPDARARIEAFHADNPLLYIQQMVPLPGRDLGVVFLGGDHVGAYARVSGGHWSTSTRTGGHYEAHDASEQTRRVARGAVAASGLAFTCVDVVEAEQGPLVFEVSAFGGFRGLADGLNVDAARLYADYALDRVAGGR